MAIDSKQPEIFVLREKVEALFGRSPGIHSDFVALCDDIFCKTREHISETTLERVWNYSTRGYETVSRRSLDVLGRYAGFGGWDDFVGWLRREGMTESDHFDCEKVDTAGLEPGARLRIGWPPDRLCVIRYLGNNLFVAEECRNSRLMAGDTFSCLHFQLHVPLYLANLTDADGSAKGATYGVGLRHGLTTLQLLDP